MTTIEPFEPVVPEQPTARVATGYAAAAFLAGGIGCGVIGLLTVGAAISEGLANLLTWWGPEIGPLSGVSGIGVIAFCVSWAVAHARWKDKDIDLKRVLIITMVLISLGFLLTFPPIFERFESHESGGSSSIPLLASPTT